MIMLYTHVQDLQLDNTFTMYTRVTDDWHQIVIIVNVMRNICLHAQMYKHTFVHMCIQSVWGINAANNRMMSWSNQTIRAVICIGTCDNFFQYLMDVRYSAITATALLQFPCCLSSGQWPMTMAMLDDCKLTEPWPFFFAYTKPSSSRRNWYLIPSSHTPLDMKIEKSLVLKQRAIAANSSAVGCKQTWNFNVHLTHSIVRWCLGK